jgi:hypothetical protein
MPFDCRDLIDINQQRIQVLYHGISVSGQAYRLQSGFEVLQMGQQRDDTETDLMIHTVLSLITVVYPGRWILSSDRIR